MKKYLAIFLFLYGCKPEPAAVNAEPAIKLLIADTTNNRKAQWDHGTITHCNEIAKQIGLKDLRLGTDSLEIRVWYDQALFYGEDLSVIKWKDTAVTISFYRFFTKPYDYGNRIKWDPFTQPIVDSVKSGLVRISATDLEFPSLDSLWRISSESEIDTLRKIGYVDGHTEVIEIADKNRYRFLRYHCANSILQKVAVRDVEVFLDYVSIVHWLVDKYRVRTRGMYY